jgi:hypothetical protein
MHQEMCQGRGNLHCTRRTTLQRVLHNQMGRIIHKQHVLVEGVLFLLYYLDHTLILVFKDAISNKLASSQPPTTVKNRDEFWCSKTQ